jgi:hypothetical protein
MFVNWSSGLEHASFSYPDYVDIRDNMGDVFEGLVATAIRPFHLSTSERNIKIWGCIVSGNYFSELGIEMDRGRGFLPEESITPGTHPVVVLSYGLWQRQFGGFENIIGDNLLLNGQQFTIVGVTKEGFLGTNSGLGTDRFVVDWRLENRHVAETLSNSQGSRDPRISASPIANTEDVPGGVEPVEADPPDASVVRVEIPWDIELIKAESMELGKRWRASTRHACSWYLERGYRIDGFYADAETKRCFYYLVHR